MKKAEWVYRELLYQRLEMKNYKFTQLGLAKKLGISLSTVNNALKALDAMSAITKINMGFKLIDPKKLLFFWASKRNLKKDIIYQTKVDASIKEIEKHMPSQIIYTAYSAYRFLFDDTPADYSEVYVYENQETLEDIKLRFPEKSGPMNLIVLKADPYLSKTTKKGLCSMANVFVDLWNIRTWYAKEFLQSLEKKINEVID